jgi:D,D-heptose 1,7-bisphosphate phosphatase
VKRRWPSVLRAIFLDRDGVVNRLIENGYVTSWDKFDFLEGVKESIVRLNEAGYLVVIITNQSAINRGLMTPEDLKEIHKKMLAEIETSGGKVDGIYHCPHAPEEHCQCRKPETGMFDMVNQDFDINYHNSWFIGDFESDRLVAERMNLNFKLAKGDGGLSKAVDKILQ